LKPKDAEAPRDAGAPGDSAKDKIVSIDAFRKKT
jgi:hypothetical protein